MRGQDTVYAVLLAAGAGARMGENKLALAFGGKTPLQLCYEAFLESQCPPERIVVAVSENTRAQALSLAEKDARVIVCTGGAARGASVLNALRTLQKHGVEAGIAAIHDAARCLVPPAVIDAAVCGAREHGCGVAAIPMRDTVRDAKGTLLPRETLFLMQTPQAFDFARILAAYEAAEAGGFQATDDCAVYAAAGYALHFTEGSIMNQKLTYRQDLPFFRAACGASLPRVGFGEDTHVLVPGRKLVLGGVEIPHETGLLGHSDADALTHAVIDALLGAAALGDIGMHFPDTDARYRGISSLALLRETAALLRAHGFLPGNVDATIIAERPKLAPYIPAMREALAQALGMEASRISVKATTSEKMNDEGAEKCITARTVCTITYGD